MGSCGTFADEHPCSKILKPRSYIYICIQAPCYMHPKYILYYSICTLKTFKYMHMCDT